MTRCTECGRQIPVGRLEAMPGANQCVRCAVVRPYTEDDLEVDGTDAEDLIHAVQNTNEQGYK